MSVTVSECAKRTLAPVRVPHEVCALMRALWHATRSLLDSEARLTEREEMYAVFEENSFVFAYAILSIGMAKHAAHLVLDSCETPTQILLSLQGHRRTAGEPLSFSALLPEEEAHRARLTECLHQNGMEYALTEKEGELTLTLAAPRFLSEKYTVCAVNAAHVLDRFYDAMRVLAGQEPKRL